MSFFLNAWLLFPLVIGWFMVYETGIVADNSFFVP